MVITLTGVTISGEEVTKELPERLKKMYVKRIRAAHRKFLDQKK